MSQAAEAKQPLGREEAQSHLATLKGWELADDARSIHKKYSFSNFQQALDFVNRVGEVAEKANHHPDLTLGWGYVGVTYTTHDIGGLHANDFKMAQATEEAFGG